MINVISGLWSTLTFNNLLIKMKDKSYNNKVFEKISQLLLHSLKTKP